MKPLIGITSSMTWEMGNDEFAGYKRNYLSFDYVNAVEKAGGIPIILPVMSEIKNAKELVSKLDGIIFSGGSDINPVHFGIEPQKGLHLTNYYRDITEIELLKAALDINLPILGVCRGFQLLNLYFGGTVHQDISNVKEITINHAFSELPGLPVHSMTIEENSILFDLLKTKECLINSHHHQVLDKVADVFKVTGKAKDGAVEAIEYNKNDRDIFAIQYHPEMMIAHNREMLPIFEWLVKKSTK